MDTKNYLDYLDKEMTIMGVLSAVCVASPAAILSLVLGKDGSAPAFWVCGPLFTVAGTVFCIFAALFFYKERSLLAWYYGQICLSEALTDTKWNSRNGRKWMSDADSWATWWPYSWGFTFLNAGFAQYLFAICFTFAPIHIPRVSPGQVHVARIIALFFCIVVALCAAILQWYVLTHHPSSDHPWKEFLTPLSKFREGEPKLPHDGVYTRLMPSATHGVGVFAIIDIPSGTSVFEPDNAELVSIRDSEINELDPTLRKLYEDFCVLNAGIYECPSNLNLLTLSWFLNSSKEPNVSPDSSLRFYSTRDIVAGEELTADYDAYSQNQTNI